ncbi:hypothetical protein GGR20_003667 [Devosia subaequoris]|uniref:Uncharacterized protein n=1 Tax=Devosia subaequoris TaxID=395930 RepID=A0A7W6IRY8_9HYPH|nr:hypothetical protein [Devosia subaequoris]MBB4053995.1 hypothetical protein [Devosia subaequoris]MCP1211546.1 hypothetical protein [Devosia subaequoris]
MTNLVTERSRDGTLTLVANEYVNLDGTPGIAIGFDGAPWHIHPPEELEGAAIAQQWARDLVADVINNRMLIVTCRDEGFEEVRLAHFEVDFKGRNESLEFRFWNGQIVSLEDLIDGKVSYVPLS